jgi:AraC-like DNA-binding protein
MEILGLSSGCQGEFTPDALSEVLQDLRLSGAAYCRSELSHPWGLDFPPEEGAVLHFVVAGQCWLRRASPEPPVRLGAGDIALLPHGAGHALVSPADGATKRMDDLPREPIGAATYRLETGGGGALTRLVCCAVEFEEPTVHPLLELMPDVLVVRAGGEQDPSLSPLLEAMAAEVTSRRVGAATVMSRLADIVIARVVRAWVEGRTHDATGWLAAIRDPRIGKALAAFHRRPAEPWSVEAMAAVASLSRSAFSERFAEVVGTSPARYVARWRMHLASAWLRKERLSVSDVAQRLGYDSEASFSRAFKRSVGVPPSAVRRPRPFGRIEPAATRRLHRSTPPRYTARRAAPR